MDQYIKALSSRSEFLIVIFVAFGLFMLGSIASLFSAGSGESITEDHLRFLLVYETLALITLGLFLSMRGWDLPQLGLKPAMRDAGAGLGMAVAAYLAYAVVWSVASGFVPGLADQADKLVAPGLEPVSVLAVSVINPFYEEVFVCGYIIAALRKDHGTWFAINTSVGIRLVYHLYQGAVGVVGIIPLGFLFAYWYARTGRLWPVIIAHGIFDFAGLMVYVQ